MSCRLMTVCLCPWWMRQSFDRHTSVNVSCRLMNVCPCPRWTHQSQHVIQVDECLSLSSMDTMKSTCRGLMMLLWAQWCQHAVAWCCFYGHNVNMPWPDDAFLPLDNIVYTHADITVCMSYTTSNIYWHSTHELVRRCSGTSRGRGQSRCMLTSLLFSAGVLSMCTRFRFEFCTAHWALFVS